MSLPKALHRQAATETARDRVQRETYHTLTLTSQLPLPLPLPLLLLLQLILLMRFRFLAPVLVVYRPRANPVSTSSHQSHFQTIRGISPPRRGWRRTELRFLAYG